MAVWGGGSRLPEEIAAKKLYICNPKDNKAMTELTIQDIETIVKRDENRIMEAKKTTGELIAGMQSGCAFLNTEGGWLFFGINPKPLKILGQDVSDQTRHQSHSSVNYGRVNIISKNWKILPLSCASLVDCKLFHFL